MKNLNYLVMVFLLATCAIVTCNVHAYESVKDGCTVTKEIL